MSVVHRLIDAGFAAGLIHPPRFFRRLYRFSWYGATLLDWAQDARSWSGASVLEVGCGPGDLSEALARVGGQVVGVDRSKRMIGYAKGRFGGVENLAFRLGDATDLGFSDRKFGAVISASLINVVPEPLEMLGEMARVTVAGGQVSVLFPTPEFTRAKAGSIAKARNLGVWSASGMRVWAGAARKLSISQVEAWFGEAGFGGIRSELHLDGALASVSAKVEM